MCCCDSNLLLFSYSKTRRDMNYSSICHLRSITNAKSVNAEAQRISWGYTSAQLRHVPRVTVWKVHWISISRLSIMSIICKWWSPVTETPYKMKVWRRKNKKNGEVWSMNELGKRLLRRWSTVNEEIFIQANLLSISLYIHTLY